MSARDLLKARITSQTTVALFEMLDDLDSKRILGVADMMLLPTQEERLVYALIADTVEDREGLGEAMERIFMADDYAGTYTEALRLAMAEVGK